MNDNALIFTNITNILLICLFVYYRYCVKKTEAKLSQYHEVLSEFCIQHCNIICICARQDYHLNKIPIDVLIDIILQQPLDNKFKFSHFQMAGITIQDLEDRGIGHVFRNYFEMGEEKVQETNNKE